MLPPRAEATDEGRPFGLLLVRLLLHSERASSRPTRTAQAEVVMAKKKEKKVEPSPECYFHQDSDTGPCSGEVEICYGCKKMICEGHSKNFEMPFGGHEPYVHLEQPEEDDDQT